MRSRLSRLKSFSATALKLITVVAIATSAHRMSQIVGSDERSPVDAGELTALTGVYQHAVLRLLTPNRHVQSLQHHIGGLSALHGPT